MHHSSLALKANMQGTVMCACCLSAVRDEDFTDIEGAEGLPHLDNPTGLPASPSWSLQMGPGRVRALRRSRCPELP